jgi:hypothetical protein
MDTLNDDDNAVASTSDAGDKQLQPAQPQRILTTLFFSVLYNTDSGKLDDYRAGYFLIKYCPS